MTEPLGLEPVYVYNCQVYKCQGYNYPGYNWRDGTINSKAGLNDSPIRIGIFGGTFDPVHFGHLRPALELCEYLSLESVRLMPCHTPAHRDRPGASTEQRIDMLNLAIDGCKQLVVDTRESQRDSYSYSVDTLNTFRTEFPDTQLLFFLGMDAFANLTNWHKWEQMLELSHLVVINRPGAKLGGAEERLLMSRQVYDIRNIDNIAGNIILQNVTQSDISATKIRHLVSQGRDIRYLLPESVRHYVTTHGIYQ